MFANSGIPLRELNGTVYGYTDGEGNIHLRAGHLNFETPIHEYGHLWNAWAKKNHYELWQRGIELAKQSNAFKALKKQAEDKGSVYHGMTDDQLADEVLADAIGKKGQGMYNEKDWTHTARVKHWLTQLWHRIGEALGFRKRMPNMAVGDMSFDDIIRTAAGDILSGKRLKGDKIIDGNRFSASEENRSEGYNEQHIDWDANASKEEKSEHLRNIPNRVGIKASGVTTAIDSKEDLEALRGVVEDDLFKPIEDYENVYLAENQSHGMMTTELITFRDRRVRPLEPIEACESL